MPLPTPNLDDRRFQDILDEARRREESSPFDVRLVAQTADVVTATGGLRVIPDTTIDECPMLDVLVHRSPDPRVERADRMT